MSDLEPRPKKPKPIVPVSSKAASHQMVLLMRVVRGLGLALGGFVAMVGVMGVVGLVTANFWARLIVALVLVLLVPAFVTERVLRRANLAGGMSLVVDVFAIVLLAVALAFVAPTSFSSKVFVSEGDHYARTGSRSMARAAYFLGGVTPVFPAEAK